MNVRPPPYNPYMYNVQQPSYLATAPPIDEFNQTNVVYIQPPQYPQNIETTANNMYNQKIYTYPTPPPQIYIPPQPNFNNVITIDEYNRQEIERKKRQEDQCCCLAILGALCCCFC
jgi:hypothetical protein